MNYEHLVYKLANIETAIQEELDRFRDLALKIEFFSNISKQPNKLLYISKNKNLFNQTPFLLSTVTEYAQNKPGGIVHFDKIKNSLIQSFKEAYKELQRLRRISPKYFGKETNVDKMFALSLRYF